MRRAPRLLFLLPALLLLGAALPRGCEPYRPGPPAVGTAPPLPALRAEPDPAEGGRIRDARGREVLLRGVNVNAFVEYAAYDPTRFTAYPFTRGDAERIASMGWNVVRLLVSWSRIEPEPGVYDERYLARVERAVRILARRGVYTILDLHQDAWGPSLAAREDEDCSGFDARAFGWDGAPAWATLDRGEPRCTLGGLRESSPAVRHAFRSFWQDAPGPEGVGIRTRYVAMLAHLAGRFARYDAVAGYDLMNEPNVIGPDEREGLDALYEAAIPAIRAAEEEAGAPQRLVFVEPSILWANTNVGAPEPIEAAGDQIVYAPHLYQGAFSPRPLSPAVFERARSEAAEILGGAPVLAGEWGAGPGRAADPDDDIFVRHQALQDRFRFGATLWTWREACGDPHKAGAVRAGRVPGVWGFFEVDCSRDRVTGVREPLVEALRRPLLRAAPGRIERVDYARDAGRLEASGSAAEAGTRLRLFWPSEGGPPPSATSAGLRDLRTVPARGGHHFVLARAAGGAWSLELEAASGAPPEPHRGFGPSPELGPLAELLAAWLALL